jgi:hypothetical protein
VKGGGARVRLWLGGAAAPAPRRPAAAKMNLLALKLPREAGSWVLDPAANQKCTFHLLLLSRAAIFPCYVSFLIKETTWVMSMSA